jgi:dTDP-4-amino-4,6-dideoxygalactose transaminase
LFREGNVNGKFIPFHAPSIGEEEIREVVETLRSGWLTTGPRTARFEREFGEYVQSPYAIAVNSATAALHLAQAALKIHPGDEVITTPMTFCATVQAILHVGATPVLADIGPDGNIDPESIERRITRRTRAIIPVHLGGLPCAMKDIWSLARRRGIAVIHDAAHAAGTWYEDVPIGAAHSTHGASDAVAFSFYATKNMTTGEGGMLTTPRADMAEAARTLSLHGMSRDAWNRYTEHGKWQYEIVAHGFKYNLSDLQSAIGIHQLRKLDQFLATRADYADRYNRAFCDLDTVDLPPDNPRSRHAWHLYILRLNLDKLRITRDEFIRELHNRGIGTSVHFIPIPVHRFFADSPISAYPCPEALKLYSRTVSLPLYPAMTAGEVNYVAHTVRDILERARRPGLFAPILDAAAVSLRPRELPCAEGSI